MRDHGHRRAVTRNCCSVDPRRSRFYACVVEKIPHLEIVCTVEHDRCTYDQRFDVSRRNVRDDCFNADVRVYSVQSPLRRNRFRNSILCVFLTEQRLSLKVRRFDKIAVDYPDAADARTCEHLRMRRAESSAADQDNAAGTDLFLAGRSDLRE